MLARFGILPALAIKAASRGTGRPSRPIEYPTTTLDRTAGMEAEGAWRFRPLDVEAE
jgi:hypothetical protein